jgi:hypothetical protein
LGRRRHFLPSSSMIRWCVTRGQRWRSAPYSAATKAANAGTGASAMRAPSRAKAPSKRSVPPQRQTRRRTSREREWRPYVWPHARQLYRTATRVERGGLVSERWGADGQGSKRVRAVGPTAHVHVKRVSCGHDDVCPSFDLPRPRPEGRSVGRLRRAVDQPLRGVAHFMCEREAHPLGRVEHAG